MTNSIFQPKKGKRTTKKISVVVSEKMHAEMEEIERALAEKDPSLVFNTNAICVEALELATSRARRELAKM